MFLALSAMGGIASKKPSILATMTLSRVLTRGPEGGAWPVTLQG